MDENKKKIKVEDLKCTVVMQGGHPCNGECASLIHHEELDLVIPVCIEHAAGLFLLNRSYFVREVAGERIFAISFETPVELSPEP